jgi:predicted RNA-binding Zn ribbon-like protein
VGQTADRVSPIPVNPANALCLDFVNSAFADHTGITDLVFDRLASPQWWKWMASRWRLRLPAKLTPADSRKLRQFRTKLRGMLVEAGRGRTLAKADLAWLNQRLAQSPRRLSLPAGGKESHVVLAPLSRNWDAVIAEVILSYVALMREGNPRRIRRCANPSCSWLFYDDSRNRSRRWCDPRYCGNLIKVRRHRARKATRRRSVRSPSR